MRYVVFLALALCVGCSPAAKDAAKPQECKAPPAWWVTPERVKREWHGEGDLAWHNRVDLLPAGQLQWNRQPVSKERLADLLHQALPMRGSDIMFEHATNMNCADIENVRTLIEQQVKCSSDRWRCLEGVHDLIVPVPPPPPKN